MNFSSTKVLRVRSERGAIGKNLLVALVILAVGAAWLLTNDDVGQDVKKQAKLKAMEKIGEIAASALAANGAGDGSDTHGSAVDMIRRPIEVRKIADNIHYAAGVGNTIMIDTAEGVVIYDTGLVLQSAKQLRLLKEQVSDAPVHSIILSHSHADHIGGVKFWMEEGSEIIAHKEYSEEQRYLTELEPYLYGRNRTLFPWIPEKTVDIEMMRYGGITPTITVDDEDSYTFVLGDIEFQVIGAPGAEGADNIVLWLPEQKILFTGDFFGPQFPQFPNIFTMRGEKIRKPMEYVASLNKLMLLEPEIVVPSHLDPTVGAQAIRQGMEKIRDAVQYVHDETVAGMNAGKSVNQLMKEIELPPNLSLVQNHGKVDWAVKSIWDYYATWFHFESTTELYPVAASEVYSDLAEVAGSEALLTLGQKYIEQDFPVKALHTMEVALAGNPQSKAALEVRQQALNRLMAKAESGVRNDYEIYWLKSRLADTAIALEAAL
ncbi:MAG: alkyl sulfatase BDS1-like metallo-beta-lactamase superfamily hydrolase [Halioglobus sp.]|jgi:alkyl sulfatase BDS1-like metallo-beta-lactamase superfamily hydrolase